MTKRKQTTTDKQAEQVNQFHDVFALDNVTKLREAVDQVVYGETTMHTPSDSERAHTIEGLTTLGQMGLLTETDLDEARKGYL